MCVCAQEELMRVGGRKTFCDGNELVHHPWDQDNGEGGVGGRCGCGLGKGGGGEGGVNELINHLRLKFFLTA